MSPCAYIQAAGGIGQDGVPLAALDAATKLAADARPVDLRRSGLLPDLAMPRLASRLAQLAVAGARQCVGRLTGKLQPNTSVYLATGLGDVARTDALYYEVMPPRSEMASPAQFAASGNNMPAFFVAQQLGLVSRNFTVAQEDLSFEHALLLAIDDLAAGATATVLLGGADETTLPREFYVRRYPLSADKFIGEGSAWMVLSTSPVGAIGEVLSASVIGASHGVDPDAWATRVALATQSVIETHGISTLLPGGRISTGHIAAFRRRMPALEIFDYRGLVGCSPTATALAVVGTLTGSPQSAGKFLHLSCDARGCCGVIAWERYTWRDLPGSRAGNGQISQ